MKIGIVRCTTDDLVTHAVLEEIASELENQSALDVAPFCQSAPVPCAYFPDAVASIDAAGSLSIAGLPPDVAPHLVLDSPDQAGELGDHFVTESGLPVLRSYWQPVKAAGGTLFDSPTSLSVTMSHENTEADGDPYVNLWADMPDGQTEDAVEWADRVEAFGYKRPGSRVYLSNFLGPRAFRLGDGPYDFMTVLKDPFEIPPGCYAVRRVGGPAGATAPAWGERYPDWRRALRLHPSSKLSRRVRGARRHKHLAAAAPPKGT